MEKVIKIETDHDNFTNKIEMDNSTEFKDFMLTRDLSNNGKDTITETLGIHLDSTSNELKIGKFKLIGREVELLKEFLNQ